MGTNTISKKRPISPHITIYKWQITSVLSILHRGTGIVVFVGLLKILWIMIYFLTMTDPNIALEDYLIYQILTSKFGWSMIFLWSWCMFFHLCTGIRHLFWDIGYGYDLKIMRMSGWIAVIASLFLTLGSWYVIK